MRGPTQYLGPIGLSIWTFFWDTNRQTSKALYLLYMKIDEEFNNSFLKNFLCRRCPKLILCFRNLHHTVAQIKVDFYF